MKELPHVTCIYRICTVYALDLYWLKLYDNKKMACLMAIYIFLMFNEG